MPMDLQPLGGFATNLEAQRLAQERVDAIKLHQMRLIANELAGQGKVLLRLLELRFGAPSEEVRARVASARFRELDTWTTRILTARTLDELFAPVDHPPLRLSEVAKAQYMTRRRADEIRLRRLSLVMSEAKGQAMVLLRLLDLRFGPVPEETRRHVEAGTLKQLGTWTERILTARTLDEVFAM